MCTSTRLAIFLVDHLRILRWPTIYGSPAIERVVDFQGKPPNMKLGCKWCGLLMFWTVSLAASEDVLKLVNVVSRVNNLIRLMKQEFR